MAENTIKVRITLEGVAEFKAALKGLADAGADIKKSFANLGGAVGKSIKEFTKLGVAATGAAAGIVALTAKNAAAAEQIENLSKATGASVEELQVLNGIAETSGVSQDALAKGLKRLTLNLNDLRDPTSTAAKNLAEVDEALARSVSTAPNLETAFSRIREGLVRITDENKRAEIATQLFGKAGIELLPILTQTEKEYEKQRQKLIDLGVVLGKTKTEDLAGLDDAFDDVKLALKGLGLEISAKLAPALAKAAKAFTEFVVKNRAQIASLVEALTKDGIEGFTKFFKAITSNNAFAQVSGQIKQLASNIGDLLRLIPTLTQSFTLGFQAIAAAFNPLAAALGIQGGGQQLLITIAVLEFVGVLRVLIATAGLLSTILRTSLIPTMLYFAGIIPAIIIKNIFLWIASMGGLRAALLSTFLIANLQLTALGATIAIVRTAFIAMWLAATGPVGLVVGALALVGFGLFQLIKHTIGWDEALRKARETVLNIPIVFQQKVEDMKAAFIAFGNLVKTIWDNIKVTTTNTISDIVAKAREILPSLAGVFSSLTEKITGTFRGWAQALKDAFSGAVQFIKQSFVNFFTGIGQFFNSMIQTIRNKINEIRTQIRGAVEAAKGLIPGQKEQFGPGFATGGHVRGPGTSTSDSIPAWLSNNEFVVQAQAVRKYGVGFMQALNRGLVNIPQFAMGGLAEAADAFAGLNTISRLQPVLAGGTPATTQGGRPLNLILPNGDIIRTTVDNDTARRLQKDLRRSDSAKNSRPPRWYK